MQWIIFICIFFIIIIHSVGKRIKKKDNIKFVKTTSFCFQTKMFAFLKRVKKIKKKLLYMFLLDNNLK